MDLDVIRRVYYETLKELSKGTGKTVEELDEEISKAIENCKDIEDILFDSSEVL